MPIYTYRCRCGTEATVRRSFSEGPTPEPCLCGGTLEHEFLADVSTVAFDVSGCRDHNFIPPAKRVFRKGSAADAGRTEAGYAKHVKERRAALKDGGNQGKIRQSMAIPADLYHGKIRETKDKNYWADAKNVAHHSDFKVDR